MRTPDGREFNADALAPVAARALAFARLVLRALGKLVATVWRLAGALDAALWRGVKLGAVRLGAGLRVLGRIAWAAGRDFVRWLPTRSGRAYSAFSGAVLIVSSLWIVDELRVAPSQASGVEAGAGRPPADSVDPIVARIAGRYVHLSEVTAAALASGALREGETLTPETAFSRELVEAYVEQRLLARAALETGLQRAPNVARQINAARDRILAAAYLQARVATDVTDESVERLYRAQSDVTRLGDEVRARQIVVETGAEAERLIAELAAGADFAELARQHSLDRATALKGGDIGYFSRHAKEPVFAAAAFSTARGEIAPPFLTEHGWHVLQVTDRRPTSGVPLSAVSEGIRRFLTLRTIEAALAQVKEANDVVYYRPEAGGEGGGGETSARADWPSE